MKPLLLTLIAFALAGCGESKPERKKSLEDRSPGPKGAGHVTKGADGKVIVPESNTSAAPVAPPLDTARPVDPVEEAANAQPGVPSVYDKPVSPSGTSSAEAKAIIRPKR